MNIAIVGSRNYPTPALVQVIQYLQTLTAEDVIVTGGAIGIDLMAEVYAREHFGMKVIVHKPNWGRYGHEAGKVRNVLIVRDADKVVAFWAFKSPGTSHSIGLALGMKKPLEIHFPDGKINHYNKGLF